MKIDNNEYTDIIVEALRAVCHSNPAAFLVITTAYIVPVTFLSFYSLISIKFLLASAFLGAALLALSLIDVATLRLPDAMTIPLAISGCLLAPAGSFEEMMWRAVSAPIAYAILFAVSRSFLHFRGYPGLGLGDAKLFAASAAWLGLEQLPFVLLLACTSALLVIVVFASRAGKVTLNTRLPFGPFLAFGTWIVWLLGPFA